MKLSRNRKRGSASLGSAFTLVEVVLAILIIVGILGVVLYFYQQAAEVRRRAVDETEYITVARMFLEQMTGELRAARSVETQFAGLEGTSNSLSFVTASMPNITRWIIRTNETAVSTPTTDLKRIRYTLLSTTNLADSEGLQRSEEFLNVPQPALVETNAVSTNAVPRADTNVVSAPPPPLGMENTNLTSITNEVAVATGNPLTDQIRFLQFRYWSGVMWTDSWSGMELPSGVEVTIGHEAMPKDVLTAGYPFEIFQRVIYLPESPHPGNKVAPPEGFGPEL